MAECILIKDFNHSCSGCEAGCQNVSTMTAARPGWVTSNKVSGSSLFMSVSDCITTFPPFICMQNQPYFAAQHNVTKNMQKAPTLLKKYCSCDDSSKPVTSTSSEPVDNKLPTEKVINNQPGICEYQQQNSKI